MHWRRKSAIQRVCARLPIGKEQFYFQLQRRFGQLSRPHDPSWLLTEAVRLSSVLEKAGPPIEGSRVMEIGTGWRIDMPIGFFLCGAKSVVTVDLYRHLKPDLAMDTIRFLRENRETSRQIFSSRWECSAFQARLQRLEQVTSFSELQEVAKIEYRAPSDAANPGLPDGSIDLQVSYTVFEHIPGAVLLSILKAANRLLAPKGVTLHHVDLSDHFAHDDRSISLINFLRFSDEQWRKLGGNQFAYHNRLRIEDYKRIYAEAGHQILQWQECVDTRSLHELENGFPLHEQYRQQPFQMLSTTILHVLSAPPVKKLAKRSVVYGIERDSSHRLSLH